MDVSRPDANQHVIIEDRLSARARYKRNNWQPRQLHKSVHVVAEKDQQSTVDWEEASFDFENLSLVARADGYMWDTQAYIKLAGANHTSSVHARTITCWDLLTPNTQSHQLEIAYEITYTTTAQPTTKWFNPSS